YTPLHISARKNQMDIATTLLEYTANPNAESKVETHTVLDRNGFEPVLVNSGWLFASAPRHRGGTHRHGGPAHPASGQRQSEIEKRNYTITPYRVDCQRNIDLQ